MAQPLIADPETEPYKYDIQRLAIYNLIPGSTASVEDKIQGKQVQLRKSEGPLFLCILICSHCEDWTSELDRYQNAL